MASKGRSKTDLERVQDQTTTKYCKMLKKYVFHFFHYKVVFSGKYVYDDLLGEDNFCAFN